MEFKDYVTKVKQRMEGIEHLFTIKELIISFDELIKKKKVEQEVLFFKNNSTESTGIFLFGMDYFLNELNEQEFKRLLSFNSLNFRIRSAYNKLVKKAKKVKITDIINVLHDKAKDSFDVHKSLTRMLTLSYYLNWKQEKDKKDLEGDSYVEIPDNFLIKLKQRYNFDVFTAVYENSDLLIFINARGKLNLVFKTKDEFTKDDVKKLVIPVLKKIFNIKKIELEN